MHGRAQVRLALRIATITLAVVGFASGAHADDAAGGGTKDAPAADGAQAGTPAEASTVDSADAEARSLFRAGVTAYDAGRYQDALGHFRRAFELSDRPQMLFNIAQAADRLRLDDQVLEALRAYRERVPDAHNREQVDNRIRALEARQHAAAAEPPEAAPKPATEDATAAAPAASLRADAPGEADDDGGILSTWWFWTAAGAVVASVVVGVAVASSDDGGTEDDIPGTDGMVILTLGGR